MEFDFIEIGKAFMVLFAVIDIFGSIPVIIKIKQSSGEVNALRASLVSFVIMIAFLFGGEMILNALGVNIKAFAMTGSLIIFAIAAEMIFGVQLFRSDASSAKIVSVVPIAFPLIAGAGTMTTLVSLRAEYAAINISIAVFLNVIVVYLVLRITKKLEEILGAGGIAIIKKVFGIILLAIAVKLFADNAKALFTM
ncbi:MAG: MarC family protein [Crocinitomicaceae bacterium]|nr:MarC family protein [Crocinitomicaceae bacterium]